MNRFAVCIIVSVVVIILMFIGAYVLDVHDGVRRSPRKWWNEKVKRHE